MINKRIRQLIKEESKRQNEGLELIASENYASKEVKRLCGSLFTNKYAEGFPGKRYYGGCEVVDKLESECQKAICDLFDCEFANVQPHSGSQANAAAFKALEIFLFGKDKNHRKMKILSLSLDEGSHLTHGSPVSFSSYTYDFSFFKLGKDGKINFKLVEAAIKENKPDVILCGYSAYPYIINFKKFKTLAKKYNCLLMADVAHIAGLIVTGNHPSPFPYCDIVTSTTHKTLRGPRGGIILTNNKDLYKFINFAIFPYSQGGPLENIIAAKYQMALEDKSPKFKKYIDQVVINTKAVADHLKLKGVKVFGTENHLFLIDVMESFKLTGKIAQERLEECGITVNKNMIPGDKLTPTVTSGLRIGLAALTTRGLKEEHCIDLANLIYNSLQYNSTTKEDVKAFIKKNKLKKI